jgi:DNA-binding beta-propeller fold protein YncE
MLARILLLAGFAGAATLESAAGSAADALHYSISGRLSGSGGSWDYAVIDERTARLYLAQSGVTAVDLKSGAVTTGFVSARETHGLALLGDGTVAVDDSRNQEITVFDGISGRVVSRIATAKDNPGNGGHALDALVREPRTGLLIAVNGDSGLLLLVDVHQSRVIGTMSIGGHPEFAAADGAGKIFINVNRGTASEVVEVDIAARVASRHTPLPGCEGATGLAFDEADHLILSVCDNGILNVLDARTHRVVNRIPVGRGADAVMFDPTRRRAFIASGDSGSLSVIAIRSADDIALVQALKTQVGTRLGAVDAESGRVYLPSAKFGPPKAPSPYPSVLPGTFEFLVAAPN